MRVTVQVAILLAFAVLCGAAPPPRPVGIAILRNIMDEDVDFRNHIPNRFQIKGTILQSGNVNQKVQPVAFQRIPNILRTERNHIPNRFGIKPKSINGAGQQPQGQVYQPAPAAPDCCNPGGFGQYPPQVPGQYPPQYPGQYPPQFTPPECCNLGGMGQYPPPPPPTGCCGAAPQSRRPGSSGGLLVPLRGKKGKKNGFLRIGQNGSIRKLPPTPPILPAADPRGQGAPSYGAPQPYGASPVPGQGAPLYDAPQPYGDSPVPGAAPYGVAPPQQYDYQQDQGSYPQPLSSQEGYNPQMPNQGSPMDQQFDDARQPDTQGQANNAPLQGPSQVQPQFPQPQPFQQIQGQAYEAKKRII